MIPDERCPECWGEPETLIVTPAKLRRRCTECGHKWSEGRPVDFDLRISGSMGLYRIHAASQPGKAWVRKNLSRGQRVVLQGDTICDSGQDCRAIVAAAVSDGVAVSVNGIDMEGFES